MKTKHFFISLSLAIFSCAMFSSCNNGELTASDVEKEVERVGAPLFKMQVKSLKTGYYELNDEAARYKLRKLAAAGMITYSAQNIIETKKSYWGDRKYDHVFVEVALTEEGQKYVVSAEEYEKRKAEVEEFYKKLQNEEVIDKNAFPEAQVAEEENVPVLDETLKKAPAQEEEEAAPAVEEEAVGEIAETAPKKESQAAASKSAYEKACDKVHSEEVWVETVQWELSDVENIKCTQEMLEQGVAKATAVFECVKSTPFGRILEGDYEGETERNKIDFELYADGWKTKEMPK